MAQKEGWLLIDHHASPGLPEDLALAHGFDPKLVGEGKIFETGTLCCSHCKTVQMKNPLRTRERGYCHKCMHYVCDLCAEKMKHPDYVHNPFMKIVDTINDLAAKGIQLGSPSKLLIP